VCNINRGSGQYILAWSIVSEEVFSRLHERSAKSSAYNCFPHVNSSTHLSRLILTNIHRLVSTGLRLLMEADAPIYGYKWFALHDSELMTPKYEDNFIII
jgi:hypothetical protein